MRAAILSILALCLVGMGQTKQDMKPAKCIPQSVADYMKLYHPTDEIKPVCASDPMDVPAITKPAKSWIVSEVNCDTESGACIDGALSCINHGTMTGEAFQHSCKDGYVFTCADKSRILLTDEQGGKHCLKFPKG